MVIRREALAYIESVQEPLQCKMIPVHTGVDIVDTVIYEAKEKAEQRNILYRLKPRFFRQN